MTQQRFVPENPVGAGDAGSGGSGGESAAGRGWGHVLKSGRSFAVLDAAGDVRPGVQGLYHGGTRYLSRLVLEVDGESPVPLHAAVHENNRALTVHLTDRAYEGGGPPGLPRGVLHLERTLGYFEGRWTERLRLTSFDAEPHRVRLSYRFEGDFKDLFEIRGIQRAARGTLAPPVLEPPMAVRLGYRGLDEQERVARLRFHPRPTELTASHAAYDITLSPGAPVELSLEVEHLDDTPSPMRATLTPLQQGSETSSALFRCELTTSNALLDRWIRRSSADLDMLVTHLPEGPYPFAGLPWFSTVFGRDALLTSLFTLWRKPALTRAVLRFLARTQATEEDPERDAQPGKVLHELRDGEMAALGEIPFAASYASVDATPLFVMLAGAYLRATGDLALIQQLWPNLIRALDWMGQQGDRDGDGFVEYPRSGHGLVNQGWKDSPECICHADGKLAEGEIALCEVQGYVYAARREGAAMARAVGDGELASRFETSARDLRERFDRAFWSDALGSYAVALDGDKRRCEVGTSNPGHLLLTGIVPEHRVGPVVSALFAPDLFSGWGVRTFSSRARRYNPMSYHNGSVWPHDNAVIAMGLAACGETSRAAALLDTFFDVSSSFELQRLPELFCGFERRPATAPTPYPSACSPQAWAAGAVFAFLGSALGLQLDAAQRRVTLRRPVLPETVDEIRIRGLSVGTGRIDLLVHRHKGEVGVTVERMEGDVEISMSP